jgi:hypothetical protein
MPTEYEDENEYDGKDEPEETFADKYGFENLNIQIPNVSPEEEKEIRARLRCGWNMSGAREAELNAVAEKWLDDYLTRYEDAVVPRSKEKMLRLITEVILPACKLFGLHDDADLERKLTPDDNAIELIIDSVDDFFYGDDHGIRVNPL